ncbi:MAG: DNA mismatch repair endonuclease MutL [Rikenellaceae bacterium]
MYALHTFGFRGEALAAISAVSEVELYTRREEDEIGTHSVVKAGRFISQSPAMCERGANFVVRNIYQNVPARRRFADNDNKAAGHIKAEFKYVALCYPQIRFELYSNDAPIYNLAPNTLAGRIVDLIGRSIKNNLLEIHADTSIVKIHGYIGRPSSAKKSNTDQYFYVNGRYFKSSALAKAILKGYDKLIVQGYNPSFFIFLEVAPDRVDVNAHPQKIEVQFADNDAIWQILNAATRETLAKTGAMPMMEFDQEASLDIPVAQPGVEYEVPKSFSEEAYNPFDMNYIDTAAVNPNDDFAGFDMPLAGKSAPRSTSRGVSSQSKGLMDSGYEVVEAFEHEGSALNGFDSEEVASAAFASDEIASHSFNTMSYDDGAQSEFEIVESQGEEPQTLLSEAFVAQPQKLEGAIALDGGYIASRVGRELVFIDSRRARERMLYDHYMKILSSGATYSQHLLFPVRLTLSNDEYDKMQEHSIEFAALGFDVEYRGDGVIEVSATPADISTQEIDTLLYELIHLLDDPHDLEQERLRRLSAVMAKAGVRNTPKSLSAESALEIVEALNANGMVEYTPQSKPIFWRVGAEEIKIKLG